MTQTRHPVATMFEGIVLYKTFVRKDHINLSILYSYQIKHK